MIAVDASSLVAFLAGEAGDDVESVDQVLELNQAVLPPVVLTELLSSPGLHRKVARLIQGLPVLEIQPGFWERAGMLRAKVLKKRLRARLADTLIAQSCLDHRTPLITRDTDFRHFVTHGGLQLL
jgi:predicted nucleic acid-binding protein